MFNFNQSVSLRIIRCGGHRWESECMFHIQSPYILLGAKLITNRAAIVQRLNEYLKRMQRLEQQIKMVKCLVSLNGNCGFGLESWISRGTAAAGLTSGIHVPQTIVETVEGVVTNGHKKLATW